MCVTTRRRLRRRDAVQVVAAPLRPQRVLARVLPRRRPVRPVVRLHRSRNATSMKRMLAGNAEVAAATQDNKSPALPGFFVVRLARAHFWRCESSREQTTASEVKRNCARVTERGEKP